MCIKENFIRYCKFVQSVDVSFFCAESKYDLYFDNKTFDKSQYLCSAFTVNSEVFCVP